MKKKLAHTIGHTLAYFQDTVDTVVTWGFSKLQNAGDQQPKPNEKPFFKFARNAAGFLGDVGSEYYRKYEEIKYQRENEKGNHKKG